MVTWMTMPEDQTEREKFLRLYGACGEKSIRRGISCAA